MKSAAGQGKTRFRGLARVRFGLTRWIGYHNADRPHSGLADQTPNEAYGANEINRWLG